MRSSAGGGEGEGVGVGGGRNSGLVQRNVAGLLGTNIALNLLENKNYIIYGVDCLQNSDVSSLYMLLKNDRFNFIQGDINKLNLPLLHDTQILLIQTHLFT